MKYPKTFCIALKNHETSLRLLNDCLNSAKNFNWNVEIFWGINGKDITSETWNRYKIPQPSSKKFATWPSMQGCFLSNFLLWEHCLELQEPIIILEHDAIINKEILDTYSSYDLVKLHRPISATKENIFTGKWNFGTHGYFLNPNGARKLIDWVKNNFPYNPDILIGDKIVNYKNLEEDIILINKNAISTTQR